VMPLPSMYSSGRVGGYASELGTKRSKERRKSGAETTSGVCAPTPPAASVPQRLTPEITPKERIGRP